MYRNYIKPIFDFIVSLTVFVLLLPVFLAITIFLALANRGTPFFFQSRPGKYGKIFRIIKFKTMSDKRDETGMLLPDAERITKIGAIIRKTSLDEIPQLVNVITGDMSLVGPRPLLTEYLNLYTPVQRKRHDVKPGITGWAQVNGRNAITWEEKFKLDVWYVENLSVTLDIRILFMTFLKVFRIQDVNQQGSVSAEKFTGE